MIKFLFFDYRQIETIEGFVRRLEKPRKHSSEPLISSIQSWGGGYMSLYGSVIHRSDKGLFQLWYTTQAPKTGLALAYAESNDGIKWERPLLDIVKVKGKKTNIVFDQSPHGAAVFYDRDETRDDWKYKMMAGTAPSHKIGVFRSPDGMNWSPAAENPVIGSNPDCPISFSRLKDGRYVAYHRARFGDRRVGRTESWNFKDFSEAVVVMEPDQCDPPNIQFYGLGATPYGSYMIGTLWVYHTDVDDMDFYKAAGYQEPEFVHSRGSYCWHRTAQGCAWIPVERDKTRFDSGQIQPASQPVFLDDEIRFYYVGTSSRHGGGGRRRKSGKPGAGLGFASCRPDRFVSVTAKKEGRILTRPFWTETPRFCVNARIGKGGWLKAEILDTDGRKIPGFDMKRSVPVTGDLSGHVLAWKGEPDLSVLAHREIRIRIQCRNTALYSIYSGTAAEEKRYWEFRIASWLNMEKEKEHAWVLK